jgi:hypothetical protein
MQTGEANLRKWGHEGGGGLLLLAVPSIASVLNGESNSSQLLVPISRWLSCLWSSFLFGSRVLFLF